MVLHDRHGRWARYKAKGGKGMPRSTPKRANRQASEGSRFLEEVLAANVRGYRLVQGMDQAELARRMAALGHRWDAGTVGFVERGDRNVTVSELLGLMLALGKTFAELVDPTGVDGSVRLKVDIGFPEGPIYPPMIRDWLHGDVRFTLEEYDPEIVIRIDYLSPEFQMRYLKSRFPEVQV
jgi:transcriptional regulator with XRE-family HTH domain